MRVRLRFWLTEPDVPVRVSVDVPSGVPGLLTVLFLPLQPASNDRLTKKRAAAHNKGVRLLRRRLAKTRSTKDRKAKGRTGTRVGGMRQSTGGTAEAAVVLTVTVKGTAAFPVTDTVVGGLHVA